MTNPQIESLEKVAKILAKVPEKFVFTGGATIVLYVDEIIRDELRSTKDVDCVVEIFSRAEYYQLSEKLREVGLAESTESNVLCRWQYEEMLIDIMPCGEEVLGFSNRWYIEGIKKSITYVLPSGREIQIFPPLYLLTSKVEAFLGRGESFYHSKDIEDIIVLLDGCEVLPQEFDNTAEDIKLFLQQWFQENIENLKDAAYNFSPTSSANREDLVIDLIERFARVN